MPGDNNLYRFSERRPIGPFIRIFAELNRVDTKISLCENIRSKESGTG